MTTRRQLPALFIGMILLQIGDLPRSASAFDAEETNPVTTVKHVDLERYGGTWYEIAKIPNRFQKHCVRGTIARYIVEKGGRITVINSCFDKDGKLDEAKGVAKIEDTASNSMLKVSFVSFFGFRPFWGDYWIIGLDEDYEWAIVGTPDRKYGWILARSPLLAEDTLEAIFAIIEQNGYSRDRFETSRQ